MFDITTLSAAGTSTLELVGGDDAPLYDDKGKALSITAAPNVVRLRDNLLRNTRGKRDQT